MWWLTDATQAESEIKRLIRMLSPYAQIARIETTPSGVTRVYVEGMTESQRILLSRNLEVYVATGACVEILEAG